jgi:hypothetical protein
MNTSMTAPRRMSAVGAALISLAILRTTGVLVSGGRVLPAWFFLVGVAALAWAAVYQSPPVRYQLLLLAAGVGVPAGLELGDLLDGIVNGVCGAAIILIERRMTNEAALAKRWEIWLLFLATILAILFLV